MFPFLFWAVDRYATHSPHRPVMVSKVTRSSPLGLKSWRLGSEDFDTQCSWPDQLDQSGYVLLLSPSSSCSFNLFPQQCCCFFHSITASFVLCLALCFPVFAVTLGCLSDPPTPPPISQINGALSFRNKTGNVRTARGSGCRYRFALHSHDSCWVT